MAGGLFPWARRRADLLETRDTSDKGVAPFSGGTGWDRECPFLALPLPTRLLSLGPGGRVAWIVLDLRPRHVVQ